MANETIQEPLKVYEVIKNSTLTYHELELRHNGTPFLWANLETHLFHAPIMTMHTHAPNGPVVAGARFPQLTSGIDVTIGDPAKAQDENYAPVEQDSILGSSYVFPAVDTGHMYEWRRTHNKDFGSTLLSNSDFKLVDPVNNDLVLAGLHQGLFFAGPSVGHIDFLVRLEDDLELQAITAILAIEEKLRRQRSH